MAISPASDENALIRRIQTTHGPENHEINIEPLLNLIEVIMDLSPGSPGESSQNHLQVETLSDENLGDMREHLAYKINSISCEILGNCSGGQDGQETVLAVFSSLSSFSWIAKGVIALAAFAVNYGEFCLVEQLRTIDPIAKSLANLEKLPKSDHIEFSQLKSKMANLTKALLDLTKCICEFKDLKSEKENIKHDSPEFLSAQTQFPTATYWIIRSIVMCQSQIINLTATGYEDMASQTQAWQLTSLANKVVQQQSHLTQQLDISYRLVEENRVKDAYQKIVKLFELTHNDNAEVLKALVGSETDALFNGHNKEPDSANSLAEKIVLLYISGPELFQAELSVLIHIYNSSFKVNGDYDVVWLPIVEKSTSWNETKKKKFEDARASMPWFSLREPSLLDPAVIEYIKNVWHFKKTSIIVTLSSKGKIMNSNALYMMLIWGSKSHPFTSSKEEQLWAAETWRFQLLVDSVVPSLNLWIAERKFICLYGGEDMEWIRKFTSTAKSVAQNACKPFEMLYMGTSNPKEKVQRNNNRIAEENLSSTVADINQIWLFWFRLECIWYSRVNRGMSPETDRTIQGIFVMRSFECSERGWAIISEHPYEHPYDQIAKGMGDTMLQCLIEFDQWQTDVEIKGFVAALNDHMHRIGTPASCNRLVLPETSTGIPKKMICFECGRLMDRSLTFSCSGEELLIDEQRSQVVID